MSIIVQKFGGTSVATKKAQNNMIKHIKKCLDENNKVVVVVSAMGRKGDPYATDTLLSLLDKIDTNVDPIKKDLLMSCGEIISCSLISHILDINGVPSQPLTGQQARILTTNEHTNSDILDIDTTIIEKYLNLNKVVVIAGFQGVTWDGQITTLGRGGSDTTAVVLGGYLNAKRVDIFTDVPGIAIADPKIIPQTQYIKNISYSEMYELSSHGAKVIHPRAVKAAEKFNIPVRVRSTFSDDLGTLISSKPYSKDKKIIGIPVDNRLNKISIFFDPKNKEEIKQKINDYIDNQLTTAQNILWFNNHAEIIVPNEKKETFIQDIYYMF